MEYNFIPTHDLELHGFRIAINTGDISSRVLAALYSGSYERREVALIRKVLKPGDRVLELGSGIGVTGLAVAKIVGEKNIKSFEAAPQTLACARYNAALNGVNIDFSNAVLSPDGDGLANFNVSPSFWSSSLLPVRGSHQVTVPRKSLNNVIKTFKPNTLVMDIEGGEIEILRAADLLDIRKIIMETHYHKCGESETDQLIVDLSAKGFYNDLSSSSAQVIYLRRH